MKFINLKIDNIYSTCNYMLFKILSIFAFGDAKRKLKQRRYYLKNKSFDNIYSLGDRCLTASILKELNLRSTAGPLDWVGGGTLKARVELIKNHFESFLKRENLVIASEEINQEGMVWVRDQKYGWSFRHDFNSVNIDDCYCDVKAKYMRRIERFYKNSQGGRIFLIYLETNCDGVDEVEYIFKNLYMIKEKLRSSSLVFLYCHAVKNGVPILQECQDESSGVSLFRVNIPLDKNYPRIQPPKEVKKIIMRSILTVLRQCEI